LALAVALIGPLLPHSASTTVVDQPYAPSTGGRPLGTDHYGFDVLDRVLAGGWHIVVVSLAVVLAAYVVGLTAGILARMRGGWLDTLVMRVVDVLMGLPSLILLTVVVVAVGRGILGVAVATAIVLIPDLVRIIRAATGEVLGHDYVEAAVARGESTTALLWHEVLPNLRRVIVADIPLRWIGAVFTIATASFLGFGVQPPAPDWGLMVYENADGLTLQPLAVLVPAGMLLVLLISAGTLLDDMAGGDRRRSARTRVRPARDSEPPAPGDDVVACVAGLRVVALDDDRPILHGVDVTVHRGEVVALVGESGSGKTTTALAMLGHVRPGLQRTGGRSWLGGMDITALRGRRLRQLLSRQAAYVAQDARTALAGHLRVSDQISETLRARGVPRAERAERVRSALAEVGLPADRDFARRWPHEISGGQRQRVALAAALAHRPRLLVLDEPTSALDVATATRLLDDIDRLRRDHDLAVLLVSHDPLAVRRLADHVITLRDGTVSASGRPADALPPARPARVIERIGSVSTVDDPVLAARALGFARPGPAGHILRSIDLVVGRGASLAVLGESGSGKTTLLRCLVGLLAPTTGLVTSRGQPLAPAVARRPAAERRRIAYVPQNPYDSLNPRHTVGQIVARPLRQFALAEPDQLRERTAALLAQVGLAADLLDRLPADLSGGQRQRVALARGLACEPEVLLCDEVTSALDPASGAEIVTLLGQMRDRFGLGIVAVTHSPAFVAGLGGDVLVLHAGVVVETGSAHQVLTRPERPYTRALLAGAPADDVAERPAMSIVDG
jgi:ABC-type glutathione transport system ATPase component/ABC-type dipeptide/oligopeptide/nickel transport system permease subunit